MGMARIAQHGDARRSYVYEFVESHDLPALDLSRSLGGVLCCTVGVWTRRSPASSFVVPMHSEPDSMTNTRFGDAIFTRSTLIYSALLGCSMVACALVPCAPVAYGGSMAIASAAIIFPIMCRSLALLRYDVASLVVKSYDFWYSNAINTASCVLLGMYLNDVRAIIVVAHWLGNLNSSLADANTMLTRLLVLGSIVGAISDLLVVAYVQFGLVQAANHFVIFRYGSRVVSVEDVIVNGFATISIMLTRNAVRRIIDIKQQKRLRCMLLRCINYRCMTKLRLTEETHSIAPNERPAHGSRKQQQYRAGDKCALEHMTFVKCESEFDASHTFYPIELNGYAWSNSRRWTIGLIGFAGIGVSVVGFVDFWDLAQRRWLFALGLAATECIYIVIWTMNQIELFRGIITSFDFLFMSFQLTSAHLCICDMFHWDARCLGLLTSWLWMHFVLTADALTPVVRKKIGLQTGYLAVPVLFFVAGQIVIVYALLVGRNWDLRDRTMYHITVAEKEIEIRVTPFFFNRIATTFLWSCRILWRIEVNHPDDALVLRGKVAYAYLNQTAHRRATRWSQSDKSERQDELHTRPSKASKNNKKVVPEDR